MQNDANFLIFYDFRSHFVNFAENLNQNSFLFIKHINQQISFLKKYFRIKKYFFAIISKSYANLDLSLKTSKLEKNYTISLTALKNRLL